MVPPAPLLFNQPPQQVVHQGAPQPKVEPPKSFKGEKLEAAALESWIFQMDLYFSAANVPIHMMAVRAALNLEGPAAVWL